MFLRHVRARPVILTQPALADDEYGDPTVLKPGCEVWVHEF